MKNGANLHIQLSGWNSQKFLFDGKIYFFHLFKDMTSFLTEDIAALKREIHYIVSLSLLKKIVDLLKLKVFLKGELVAQIIRFLFPHIDRRA